MSEIKKRLDGQKGHWDRMLRENEDMFGEEASYPGQVACQVFKENGVQTILELGPGQGRDSLYFLDQGFRVHAVDYSKEGLKDLESRARDLGLEEGLTTSLADLRQPLDLADESFDACYSHMLYCMAFTKDELNGLTQEVRRVLKDGGIQAYTSRNTSDTDFGQGEHLGDNLYVDGGFIIHFIDEAMIEDFSQGFEIMEIIDFEEGGLPRKLSLVIQRKV